MIKTIITGDFFISDHHQTQSLFDSSIINLFASADYRIINLEAPFTKDEPENKIPKTGPHLRMSAETVLPYLEQLKADCITLANNHILDYGAKGLLDTFDVLKQNSIEFVGAGKNLKEANSVLSIEKDGMRIAIINFCENEWSIAEEDSPGANPMDIIDNVNQIKKAKSNHDKVICIIHGGHEYYHLPSPRMQKQYRFYADNGADAIVGHHTHCIGGYEIFNGIPIIYSLGNFIFTKPSKRDVWYKGLVVQLSIGESVKFELFPVVQNPQNFSVSLTDNREKEKTLNFIRGLNTIIDNPEELFKKWVLLLKQKEKGYLRFLSPANGIKNNYIRAAFFKTGLQFFTKRYLIYLTNIIRCEAHSDVLLGVLSKKTK